MPLKKGFVRHVEEHLFLSHSRGILLQMSWRAFLGSDIMHFSPVSEDGTLDFLKATIWSAVGWLWSNFTIYYNLMMSNATTHALWCLWCLDMISGLAASFFCGRTENGKVVCDDNGKPITGRRSWSGKKALQGVTRLVFLYYPIILACQHVRSHGNPASSLAAGTVEAYLMATILFSVWSNVSRANGDEKGQAAARAAEQTLNGNFKKDNKNNHQNKLEEVDAAETPRSSLPVSEKENVETQIQITEKNEETKS